MQINIIIVEDEALSARRLAKMVGQLMPEAKIMAMLDSVKSTLKWLEQNPSPQLGFFDIQLTDGLSFEIFEQTQIHFPVIFTTAFNEYALKAFKVNSIDYLLKPVNEVELSDALDKYRNGYYANAQSVESQAIAQAMSMLTNSYKSRFLIKVGEHLRIIDIQSIALFYSLEKAVFLKTTEGRDYAIDFTLEQLCGLVDPNQFFRVSRKYLVSLNSIADIIAYSGSRLKVKLAMPTDEDIIVSRERVTDFKEWLDGDNNSR